MHTIHFVPVPIEHPQQHQVTMECFTHLSTQQLARGGHHMHALQMQAHNSIPKTAYSLSSLLPEVGLTSIHGAFFAAHSSMALRKVPLGVSATGRDSLWPVAGHLRLPCCSHLSMYRLSYLGIQWDMNMLDCKHACMHCTLPLLLSVSHILTLNKCN